jgi:hypothetical protein
LPENLLAYIMIAVGGVLMVYLLAIARPLVERRRAKTVQAFAERRGFSYRRRDRGDFWNGIVHVLGCDRRVGFGFGKVKNVIRGEHCGRPIVGCDICCYQPKATASRRRRLFRHADEDNYLSACVYRLDVAFPPMCVAEKGLLQKLINSFSGQETRFGPDEFHDRFLVVGDEAFVGKVLHPDMIRWLTEHAGWSFTLTDDLLIVADRNRWTPGEYVEALEAASAFLDMIPQDVWREYRERAT